MENGRTDRNKRIGITIMLGVILVVIGAVAWFYTRSPFGASDKRLFRILASSAEQQNIDIKELNVYYDSETEMYYYHVKYDFYNGHDEEWWNVEQVWYGSQGEVDGHFSLSDLSMAEYHRAERNEFERVRKTGDNKTYTQEEIKAGMKKAYEQIANEEAEYEKNNK